MTPRHWLMAFGVVALAFGCWLRSSAVHADDNSPKATDAREVELFQAMDDGQVEAKFIALNDHAARLRITNKTNEALQVKLPEAFAGVPVLSQFGRGGGGRGGGGRGGGRSGSSGGSQSLGGGLGGGGGGGGGGFFSIPPEEVGQIDVAVVCLDHGKRDPSSSKPYQIVPADEHIDRPAVIELLKAFGRGELQHGAAQAATWHLNNDLSWDELAAKRQGTRRNLNRPPYFSRAEMQAAVAYANEAQRLADEAAAKEAKAEASEPNKETPSDEMSSDDFSEARSTSD